MGPQSAVGRDSCAVPRGQTRKDDGNHTVAYTAGAEDFGWAREITNQGNTLVLYQPQVDDWKRLSGIGFVSTGGQSRVTARYCDSPADE
jgi:hypothetical protein